MNYELQVTSFEGGHTESDDAIDSMSFHPTIYLSQVTSYKLRRATRLTTEVCITQVVRYELRDRSYKVQAESVESGTDMAESGASVCVVSWKAAKLLSC